MIVILLFGRGRIPALQYSINSNLSVNGPNNIAVSQRGSILMCEDGGSDPKRLVVLTQSGNTFPSAENRIALDEGDLTLIDAIYPGTKENFGDSA
ncbi:alkaline phosphatase PhoX [Hahella ganghwensis]|uniref:alkaline phosphatase PhoX n=1 Tax=Hahella ganghwensis TaxID=286420 RepID=UPI0012F728C4